MNNDVVVTFVVVAVVVVVVVVLVIVVVVVVVVAVVFAVVIEIVIKKTGYGPSIRRTDRTTDGRTNTPTYRDGWIQLKKGKKRDRLAVSYVNNPPAIRRNETKRNLKLERRLTFFSFRKCYPFIFSSFMRNLFPRHLGH